jgi:hypothetical protein
MFRDEIINLSENRRVNLETLATLGAQDTIQRRTKHKTAQKTKKMCNTDRT